ncbi:type II toxin-antitoxin system RelE family toxin [Tabrizicola flagellatus]|uniref:type II toxin-antitoxin system RelE family toxin n=1 Tax=Tabrizicola flagellatus TaxID=2593021 RepID=UPI0011F1D048|nr:type II toxin-antitoxin system RelE/ParE family toxin [Tabrizicola flagellatus]
MTRYTVTIDRPAQKQLKAVKDKRLRNVLEREILALADNPRPHGCLKLVGHKDHWRVRVGDWRIVYRIEDGRLVVVVVRVAPRGGVYG